MGVDKMQHAVKMRQMGAGCVLMKRKIITGCFVKC